MSKLSKRLPDDNEKPQPLAGENSRSKNLIIVAGSNDNLEREFYLEHRDLSKMQLLVAQIGWTHNLIILQRCKDPVGAELENLDTEVATLAASIKKNFEEVGV